MNSLMTPISLTIFAVVGGITLLFVILIYNGIIQRKNRMIRAWSDVIAFERQKLTTLPTLEAKLKEYGAYERSLMESVTRFRTGLDALDKKEADVSQLGQVEADSRHLLRDLKLTAEAYPALQASNLVMSYLQEFSEIQANVRAGIGIFNSAVEDFNSGVQMFPWSLVNFVLNREDLVAPFTDSPAKRELEYQPNFEHP